MNQLVTILQEIDTDENTSMKKDFKSVLKTCLNEECNNALKVNSKKKD